MNLSRTDIAPGEMQMPPGLYFSMQISFEVVLESHSGPVDQREGSWCFKLIKVQTGAGFRTVGMKITCTNWVLSSVHPSLLIVFVQVS